MRNASYSTPVYCRFETLWNMLIDKAEHPEHYMPGIEEVRILERYDDGLVREFSTNGMTIREEVVFEREQEAAQVRFVIKQHPLLKGEATYKIVPTARQSPVAPLQLILKVEWNPVDSSAEQTALNDLDQAMQQSVLLLKEAAEDEDRDPSVLTTGAQRGFDASIMP